MTWRRLVFCALVIGSVRCGETPETKTPSPTLWKGTRPLDQPARLDAELTWNPAQRVRAGLDTDLPVHARLGDEEDGATALPTTAPWFPGLPPRSVPASPPPQRDGTTLTFPVACGATVQWVDVTPDTHYHLRADIERTGWSAMASTLPASIRDAAYVGRVLVLELRRRPAEPLGVGAFAAVESAGLVERHLFGGNDDAESMRHVIRTSVYTRALLVVQLAGQPGWWGDASPPATPVKFRDARLTELPLRRALASSVDASPDADPLRQAVQINADQRRALLAPAPCTWRIPLDVPAGPARLTWSYGILEERRDTWGLQPTTVRAALETSSGIAPLALPFDALQPGANDAHARWHDVRHEFTADGESATLIVEASAPSDCVDLLVIGEPRVVRPRAASPLNVLLISLDTLRADHLGSYGYQRPDGHATSPNLDALAAKGLRFDQAWSCAPYTLPSHATMMTGLAPGAHGVEESGLRLVSGRHALLADTFADGGYATAGFTAGGYVSYDHGFAQGFDRYSILDPFLSHEDRFRNVFPRPGERAFNDAAFARCDRAAIERWITAHDGEPWFLFVHSYIVHNYHPPKDLQDRFVRADPMGFLDSDRNLNSVDLDYTRRADAPPRALVDVLVDLYDATIADADAHVGALVDFLSASDLLDDTLVVVTSDHGEELGEHGGLVHGRTLYEEMQRVPLILHVPERLRSTWSTSWPENGVVERPVDLRGLAATLTDAAGLSFPQGTSWLTPRASGTTWAEVRARNMAEIYALRDGPYKLIHTPAESDLLGLGRALPVDEWQLFNLAKDPAEATNLVDDAPDLLSDLRSRLEEQRREHRTWLDEQVGGSDALRAALSADMRAQLRALGYTADE